MRTATTSFWTVLLFAAQAWCSLGIGAPKIVKFASCCALCRIASRPTTVAAKHFDNLLMLICWNLWKHRNEVIFKSLPLPHSYSRFWRACKVEARIGAADRSVRTTLCAKPGVLLFQICKHHSLLLAPRFFPPLLKIPSVTAFGLLKALQ